MKPLCMPIYAPDFNLEAMSINMENLDNFITQLGIYFLHGVFIHVASMTIFKSTDFIRVTLPNFLVLFITTWFIFI